MARKQNSKGIKIIVAPATEVARKEGYAKINGKIIPYEIPIVVTQSDLTALKGMKEPRRNDGTINVYDTMDKMKIPQEEANRLARLSEKENMGNGIKWVKKYYVQTIA